jgi:hypothetical protein
MKNHAGVSAHGLRGPFFIWANPPVDSGRSESPAESIFPDRKGGFVQFVSFGLPVNFAVP